ncbi:MAG: hypothetical protein MK135_12715 [Polyangiaceae bacterium]|nr:hypothetical protein [Polyangiaceae bacterium]
MTLDDIQRRLATLSAQMTSLIRRYDLQADSSLVVLGEARRKIKDKNDYILFLELSLEGRVLADEGERLMKAQRVLQ